MDRTEAPASSREAELTSPAFLALLGTQFLTAWNDNMFRWLVVPIGMAAIGQAQALSLGVVCFTLPYILFAALAGYLADRFSKRTVILGCKLSEVVLMLTGIVGLLLGQVYFLFAVVALMGTQSALFSPAKYGSIPEILKSEKISTGNGWMAVVTVIASALGTLAGYELFGLTEPDLSAGISVRQILPVAAALLGVAGVGLLVSLVIVRLPTADRTRRIALNPVPETARNLNHLLRNTPLLRAALGIAFFWMLASLAQVNINTFGLEVLGLPAEDIGILMVVLVAGVASGSLLAGLWSGGKVELGIVPLGAAGIAASALLLYTAGQSVDPSLPASAQSAYRWSCGWLFLLGVSAGLFNIPLESFLQHRSPSQRRGTILAASNFLSFSFMLLSGGLFYVMQDMLGMTAGEIFLAAGLATVPVLVYIVWLLPTATIRFLVWLASHTVYRVRVYGRENLPERGGALLVANHVSWLDGILLLMTSSRPIRMLAYADYVQGWGVRQLARMFGVIPIKASEGPKALLRSLKTAREAVENGELVCIFAEGRITRTGQLQPFQRGLLRIVEGTTAPVIPVYLDELWGSLFSYRDGKLFWKRPRHWPYPVSIHFGAPLRNPDDADRVRRAVQNLGVEAVNTRKKREMVLPRTFLRNCRAAGGRLKVADSSGRQLTGRQVLVAALLLKRLLKHKVLAEDERMVGILLPPSAGGVLANAAVSLLRKVAVNLNYTLTEETVNYCIGQSEIRHVLTSRKFIEKRPYDLNAQMVFLEDLFAEATVFDKAIVAVEGYALPVFVIESILKLRRIDPDDLMTVIFTSGSTGEPKGVMLSYHNVGSNVEAVDQLFRIEKTDTVLGILPFFHSFGYTMTLWLLFKVDAGVVYHVNPVDARTVGKLCEKHGVTILMGTPTFLKTYLKRCTPEQMQTLDLAIVGAERCPRELAEAFQEKFGIWPTEGYGTTELAPLVSANVPAHRAAGAQSGEKSGTVGRAVPGVAVKIIDPDTGEDLPIGQEGLLLVSGPNVMLGYLNQPEKTAEVLRDGWYDTGDMARIDEQGFIEITGRYSRFSKIGGEMVPHVKVEEYLLKIVGEDEDETQTGPPLAVSAVPDEKKGERLVVLHTRLGKSVDEVLKELAETDLPNLWRPSRENFIEVEEIPILGTGKLDLKGVKELALQKASASDKAAEHAGG